MTGVKLLKQSVGMCKESMFTGRRMSNKNINTVRSVWR